MVKVAIIKKNSLTFSGLRDILIPLLYTPLEKVERRRHKKLIDEYFESEINKYITIKDFSEDTNELLTQVALEIVEGFPTRVPGDDFSYNTETSYSNSKKYLEIIYATPSWSDYQKHLPENFNTIGCYSSLRHTIIENDCALIASSITTGKPIITDITLADVIRILKRRFYQSSVLVYQTEMFKYYYQRIEDVIDKFFAEKKDQLVQSKVNILKNELYVYHLPDGNVTNTVASRIVGYTIKDYALFAAILHEGERAAPVSETKIMTVFDNLTIHQMQRLNILAYGPDSFRKCAGSDTIMKRQNNKNDNFENETWSKHAVVQLRLPIQKQYLTKCANCQQPLTKKYTCPTTFRYKYCSNECIALSRSLSQSQLTTTTIDTQTQTQTQPVTQPDTQTETQPETQPDTQTETRCDEN